MSDIAEKLFDFSTNNNAYHQQIHKDFDKALSLRYVGGKHENFIVF